MYGPTLQTVGDSIVHGLRILRLFLSDNDDKGIGK